MAWPLLSESPVDNAQLSFYFVVPAQHARMRALCERARERERERERNIEINCRIHTTKNFLDWEKRANIPSAY
jgi:hypothetical protein